MRLTCPNCSATYELPEDQVPPGGGHVQCSACHTRWFASPAPAPERLSEDEIITRLETRAARPRPVPEGSRPIGAARPADDALVTRAEEAPPSPPVGAAPAVGPAGGAPAPATGEVAFVQAGDPPRPSPAPAPILFPAADRPAPAAEVRREVAPAGAPTPLRPRPQAERFETLPTGRAAARVPEPAPPRARRGRFAFGLLLALALAGVGLGAYLRPDQVTARAPAAAPMLEDYAARVDAARDWIETRLGPHRDRLTGG